LPLPLCFGEGVGAWVGGGGGGGGGSVWIFPET